MIRLCVSAVCTPAILLAAGCTNGVHTHEATREARIVPAAFSQSAVVRKLAIAIDQEDPEEMSAAVKAGADVNAMGTDGFRLLDWAMARNKPRGFEKLLELGATLDDVYRNPNFVPDRSYNRTVLERVLASNNKAFIEAVIRHGIGPDYVPHPKGGRSLLFYSVDANALDVIDALIDAGANINHQDTSGVTPLFDSLLSRNYITAWHLLQKGADPNIKTTNGHDFVWGLKQWGSRGVRPGEEHYFEKVVAELERRGLLTQQDIIEADKPKPSALGGPPGVTVIEHTPDSEGGRAIRELDQREREANRRQHR